MSNKTVILIGFSTAGKSHYLRTICKLNPFPIYFLDSDKFASEEYGGHIYNIFMELGREKAIEFITSKEEECINHLSSQLNMPTLVAAGPFLRIRKGWKEYVASHKPHIIYLKKSPENIYIDLCKRKREQKDTLDFNNPNFGSWDLDVTTQKINGTYQDISDDDSLKNINKLLSSVTSIYSEYGQESYDSDILKADSTKSDQLMQTIVDKLR
jgi:shikimate kinase